MHYPERVRSIILTNTFPSCCVSFRRAIEILREACGQLDGITFGRLGQWMIFAQPFQETDETYMLDSELADMAAPYPMPGYAYKAQCNAILGFDILKELPKVKAPALVVGGDGSSLFRLKSPRLCATPSRAQSFIWPQTADMCSTGNSWRNTIR